MAGPGEVAADKDCAGELEARWECCRAGKCWHGDMRITRQGPYVYEDAQVDR